MFGIEELLAQLYAQRAMQTKVESDAQTQEALATTMGPRGRGPVKQAGNSAHKDVEPVAQISPYDNMAVYTRNNEATRTTAANDVAADLMRGKKVDPRAVQGLHPSEINEAYNWGNRMAPNVASGEVDPFAYSGETQQRANMQGLVYKPEAAPDPAAREANYKARAALLDKGAQLNGGAIPEQLLRRPHPDAMWQFEGSSDSVFRNLADQLMARRAALGDKHAFDAALYPPEAM